MFNYLLAGGEEGKRKEENKDLSVYRSFCESHQWRWMWRNRRTMFQNIVNFSAILKKSPEHQNSSNTTTLLECAGDVTKTSREGCIFFLVFGRSRLVTLVYRKSSTSTSDCRDKHLYDVFVSQQSGTLLRAKRGLVKRARAIAGLCKRTQNETLSKFLGNCANLRSCSRAGE